MWCVGWQKSMAQTKDGQEIILLGGKFSKFALRCQLS